MDTMESYKIMPDETNNLLINLHRWAFKQDENFTTGIKELYPVREFMVMMGDAIGSLKKIHTGKRFDMYCRTEYQHLMESWNWKTVCIDCLPDIEKIENQVLD